MAGTAPLPPFAAIVVAAGKGVRAGQNLPKQFAEWQGKPVLRHSVEALASAGARPLVVAIPQDADELVWDMLRGIDGVELVIGGSTRRASVCMALEQLESSSPNRVLIHDAARPDLPQEVIERLVSALTVHHAAIPVLPVADSLALADGELMGGSADRDALRRVQTPQAFRFAEILAAHREWSGERAAGDDAQVLRAAGGSVALVLGDERLAKLTFAEDFLEAQTTTQPMVRTGMGYDVHRLVTGEELWLGGVHVDHNKGLTGHSDADVALHAIVDALLGAIAAGDIGEHFPPSDPQWRGARSARFIEYAAELINKANYTIGNVDLTIICEAPKIGPHRTAMREAIARMLGCELAQISVKATTTERLGFTGRGEGIAAQAIVTLQRL